MIDLNDRVPPCPDCGSAMKKVRGNYFRCPECKSILHVADWEDKLAREMEERTEFEKVEGINSCLSMGEISCDNCGRKMGYLERYCVNINEKIDDKVCSSDLPRGRRYCTECSLNAGYYKLVRSFDTGKIFPAMLMSKYEEPAARHPDKPPPVDKNIYVDEVCESCGKPLILMEWFYVNIITCNNNECPKWHVPMGVKK